MPEKCYECGAPDEDYWLIQHPEKSDAVICLACNNRIMNYCSLGDPDFNNKQAAEDMALCQTGGDRS